MNRNAHIAEHLHTILTSGKCYEELKEISSWYEDNYPKRDLLSSFSTYEAIDDAVGIDHMTDGTDVLVYHEGEENEKEEAKFDVIGILAEMNLPTSNSLLRFSKRPFSFIQQAKIIGDSCGYFSDAMDSMNSFHTFFEQNTADSNFLLFNPTTSYGLGSISANNPLVSPAVSSIKDEQCPVPGSMDPSKIVSTFLARDNRYVFTWDNEVEYLSMKKIAGKKFGFKAATPVNPGFFREGHIVRLTINMRSGVIKDDGKNLRRLLPIVRKITLMSRVGSIMIARLRAERLARGNPSTSADGVVQRTRPSKRRREPEEPDEDDTPLKMATMSMHDSESIDE